MSELVTETLPGVHPRLFQRSDLSEDFKSRRQWPFVFGCLLNGKLSIFVRAAIGSFVPFTIIGRCTKRSKISGTNYAERDNT